MSDTRYFPKEFIVEFINTYKHHPALWKIKSREYTNRTLKTNAYAALVEVCKKFDPSANRDYATKKIQTLRGSFRKEYKKVQQSRLNSISPDDIHIPTLWYYNLLLFTIDQDLPSDNLTNDFDNSIRSDDVETYSKKEMLGNIKTENITEALVNPCEETEIPNKIMRYEHDENFQPFLADSTNTSEGYCSNVPTTSELDLMRMNIAIKLSKMNQTQQMRAELLIHKILVKGLLGELTSESDVLDFNQWSINIPHQN